MATVLTEKDIIELVKRFESGPKGPMNKALILMSITTGLEMIEMTDLDVGHVLAPNGKLRSLWELPKSIAYNGHRRNVDLKHPTLVKALMSYLESLAEESEEAGIEDEFLGLIPGQPLFTNKRGERFAVTKRGNGRGTAHGLRNYVQDMVDRSHLKGSGVTPASFRRSWILHLHRNHMDPRDLLQATGMRSISTLRKVLYSDPQRVGEAMHNMYGKLK